MSDKSLGCRGLVDTSPSRSTTEGSQAPSQATTTSPAAACWGRGPLLLLLILEKNLLFDLLLELGLLLLLLQLERSRPSLGLPGSGGCLLDELLLTHRL